MPDSIYEQSLIYHQLGGRPGKIEVVPTKPCQTAHDLSLAYSPGVAEPCRRIAANPEDVYAYTNKGNLVAVITNGTAVLGLGNIGPSAGKPVMEGKGVLFKRFADIDVFDIEINEKDPDRFIQAVEAIAPTFGGINLEDIRGPECFYIEQELERRLDIPVFHDDQHGTAIIAAAGLLNALDFVNKKIEDLRCVFSGAGAAGVSVAKLFCKLGVNRANVIMCDSGGVIYEGREADMEPNKGYFATTREVRTLSEAFVDADVFIGCSVGNIVTPDMLKSMARDPIVFAMANPTPEIDYPLALSARPDVIMATGRSDYPNQINNVLGFPFIFRGALDTHATHINEEMKLAAVRSLSELAKEPVPESVCRAYGVDHFEYGRDYLIPKPFDPRAFYYVSVAVAEAAIATGVARRKLDMDEYREKLRQKIDAGRSLVAVPMQIARDKHARIAIPDGHLPKLITAARQAIKQRIALPVLIGPRDEIEAAMHEEDDTAFEIVDPLKNDYTDRLVGVMKRQRDQDNLTDAQCKEALRNQFTFATMMVEAGLCDGLLAASDCPYNEMVRPIVTYASKRAGVSRLAGIHLLPNKDNPLFFADTALIPDPSAEELAEISMRASRFVQRLNIKPVVAFINYSNFSDASDPDNAKLRRAYRIVRREAPELMCYEAVQADVALEPERFRQVFGERLPALPANILIFPNLHAANAAYRVARVIGRGSAFGPVLLGLRRPCNVLPRGSTEEEIMNMLVITAYNAHRRAKEIGEGKQTKIMRV